MCDKYVWKAAQASAKKCFSSLQESERSGVVKAGDFTTIWPFIPLYLIFFLFLLFFFFSDSVITKMIEELDLRSFLPLFLLFMECGCSCCSLPPPPPTKKKKKADHCKKFPPLKKCGCVIGFLQEDFLLASNKRLFIGIWQKSKRMNGEKKKKRSDYEVDTNPPRADLKAPLLNILWKEGRDTLHVCARMSMSEKNALTFLLNKINPIKKKS